MLSKLFMPQDRNVGPSLEQRASNLGKVPLNLPSQIKQTVQSVQASGATAPAAAPTAPQQNFTAPQLPQINIQMPEMVQPTEQAMPKEPVGKQMPEPPMEQPQVTEAPTEPKPKPEPYRNPSLDIGPSNIGPSYASQSVAGVSTAGNLSTNTNPQVSGECGPGMKKGYDGRCYPIFG